MNISVRVADWQKEGKILASIRRAVFIEEQDVPEALEWDEYDHQERQDVLYLLAENVVGDALGCVRLLSGGKITRMAVLREFRNKGVGAALLRACITQAKQQNETLCRLDAQVDAIPFYASQGFITEGSIFPDAGINHVHMSRALEKNATTQALFNSPTEAHCYIQTFAFATLRHIDILTQSLDPILFSDKAVVEAISFIARKSRSSRIRLLINEPRALYGKDIPLIRLAQRLPTHVNVKVLRDDALQPNRQTVNSYACFDDRHCLHFTEEHMAQGAAHWNERPRVKNHLEEFEQLWQTGSKEDPNFKRFSL